MNVGIIGAGIMGVGVAQSAAQAGHSVVLVDISHEVLESAKDTLHQNIRFSAFYNKDKDLEPVEEVMKRIKFTLDYQELDHIEVLIENVPELMDVKKDVYKTIDKICPPNCIFLVNTSCISITKIASITNRSEKVFGVHFMNPVPIKKTVEGIRGYHTSEDTEKEALNFLATMDKECIVVNDYPGFVSNRISHLLMNEAAYVVQDRVAEPQQVDDIFSKCFGHSMGPLATADLIGLDTVVQSLNVLYESYQDPKYRVCPLLQRMVDAGLYGKKSGEGFYKYETLSAIDL